MWNGQKGEGEEVLSWLSGGWTLL